MSGTLLTCVKSNQLIQHKFASEPKTFRIRKMENQTKLRMPLFPKLKKLFDRFKVKEQDSTNPPETVIQVEMEVASRNIDAGAKGNEHLPEAKKKSKRGGVFRKMKKFFQEKFRKKSATVETKDTGMAEAHSSHEDDEPSTIDGTISWIYDQSVVLAETPHNVPPSVDEKDDDDIEDQGCFTHIFNLIVDKIWKAFNNNEVWPNAEQWAFCPMYSSERRTPANKKLKRMMLKYVKNLVESPNYENNRHKYVFLGCFYNQQQREKLIEFELNPDNPLYIAMESMRKDGYEVVAGQWDVIGKPLIISFDIPKARKDVTERMEEVINFDHVPNPDVRLVMSDVGVFEYLVARFLFYFQEATVKQDESDNGNDYIIHRVKTYSYRSVVDILKDSLYDGV